MWFSGLSTSLWTKRSLVRFPVRAHAWVAGWVPSWGCGRGNRSMYLFLSLFLPSLLSKNKKIKSFKELKKHTTLKRYAYWWRDENLKSLAAYVHTQNVKQPNKPTENILPVSKELLLRCHSSLVRRCSLITKLASLQVYTGRFISMVDF